jgi:hypothetical protein
MPAVLREGIVIKELDEVTIPSHLAETLGVVAHGTIVWYVHGADFATVECAIVENNPDGLETKLVDVDINKLRLR